MVRYYCEYDGRVFLIRHGERWTLAADTDPLPFAVKERLRARILGEEVAYCDAALDATPEIGGGWAWKDAMVHRDDVEEVARQAMYRTMARPVAKVALVRGAVGDREVLLQVSKVGFFQGHWSLTGGYLNYGEAPDDCAVREAEEELGVPVRVGRLVAMDCGVYDDRGNWFLTFCYVGETADAEPNFKLKADEVERVEWVPLAEAAKRVVSRIDTKGLAALLDEEDTS